RQAPASAAAPVERDPLTRAYFRELARAAAPAPERTPRAPDGRELTRLLESSGITRDDTPRHSLGAGRTAREEPLVIEALRRLASEHPEKFAERSEELAYLTNVLVAGCSLDGRRLRPLEAVEHAIAA